MQPITGAFRPPGVVRVRKAAVSALVVSLSAAGCAVAAHADSRDAVTIPSAHQAAPAERTRSSDAVAALPPDTRHVTPASPCVHNRHAQLIVVSIERQHEWACAYRRTVLSTPVTTGATSRPGDATPRGTFAVQGLNRDTRLTTTGAGSYSVKYWIPFHLGVWGFHDASWQKMPFGSKHYVTHGSHGCVHMPLAAIRWLFHWVHYGTRVRIS